MKIQPLANEYVTIYDSPDPVRIFPGSPGITRLENDRLVATYDTRGPGVADLPGEKCNPREGFFTQAHVSVSDDGGLSWRETSMFTLHHARPFVAGKRLYIIGHAGDLGIIASDDNGETWSKPAFLTNGQRWHQAPCNVWYANDCIYLVMERVLGAGVHGWPVSEVAPVLMRAPVNSDLTLLENWTFSSELFFCNVIKDKNLEWHGIPFYPGFYPNQLVEKGRAFPPIGWLETNVVQILDPSQLWHDPSGKTFHLFARAHTGLTNYAALLKVVENNDGSMTTMIEKAPSGKNIVYIPFPGGQMKFHILYDNVSRLYWLVSSQTTDSLCRVECLPKTRYQMPDNQRNRLVLHFSTNCIDWCFAGLVAVGEGDRESRHYVSMVIDNDNLVILSRSGDKRSVSAHDCNLITCHRVDNFRDLIY